MQLRGLQLQNKHGQEVWEYIYACRLGILNINFPMYLIYLNTTVV